MVSEKSKDKIFVYGVSLVMFTLILMGLIYFIIWASDTYSNPVEKSITLNGTEYQMYLLNNNTWIYCMRCEIVK